MIKVQDLASPVFWKESSYFSNYPPKGWKESKDVCDNSYTVFFALHEDMHERSYTTDSDVFIQDNVVVGNHEYGALSYYRHPDDTVPVKTWHSVEHLKVEGRICGNLAGFPDRYHQTNSAALYYDGTNVKKGYRILFPGESCTAKVSYETVYKNEWAYTYGWYRSYYVGNLLGTRIPLYTLVAVHWTPQVIKDNQHGIYGMLEPHVYVYTVAGRDLRDGSALVVGSIMNYSAAYSAYFNSIGKWKAPKEGTDYRKVDSIWSDLVAELEENGKKWLQSRNVWNRTPGNTKSITVGLNPQGRGPCAYVLEDRNVDVIIKTIMSNNYDFLRDYRTPVGTWNQLSFNAVQNLGGFQGNGIAYVKEAIEMNATAGKYIDTICSVARRSGSRRLKALASAYLGIHYGFKLTYLDTKEIYNQMVKWLYNHDSEGYGLSRCQAATSLEIPHPDWMHVYESVARYQINYDPYAKLYSSIREFITEFDLDLTLENVWDLVPLSFIVDWFVAFGDMLNAIDNDYKLRTHYVVASASQSITFKAELDDHKFHLGPMDKLDLSYYKRIYKDEPEIALSYNNVTNPLTHWFEGAALIVSNS